MTALEYNGLISDRNSIRGLSVNHRNNPDHCTNLQTLSFKHNNRTHTLNPIVGCGVQINWDKVYCSIEIELIPPRICQQDLVACNNFMFFSNDLT